MLRKERDLSREPRFLKGVISFLAGVIRPKSRAAAITGVQSSVTNVFQGRLKGLSDAESDACHGKNNTRQRDTTSSG